MAFDLSSYDPVEKRLAKFWSDHPQGRIGTELVKADSGEFIVKALVWLEGKRPQPDATGFAQEREAERGVNQTSALENCETSAIGQALANLGYAAKGKRPSREEMRKASNLSRTAGETPGGSPPSPPGTTSAGVVPGEAPTPAGASGAGEREEAGPGKAPASDTSSSAPVTAGGAEATEKAPSAEVAAGADVCSLCGAGFGEKRTSSGKRVCIAGHVEKRQLNPPR